MEQTVSPPRDDACFPPQRFGFMFETAPCQLAARNARFLGVARSRERWSGTNDDGGRNQPACSSGGWVSASISVANLIACAMVVGAGAPRRVGGRSGGAGRAPPADPALGDVRGRLRVSLVPPARRGRALLASTSPGSRARRSRARWPPWPSSHSSRSGRSCCRRGPRRTSVTSVRVHRAARCSPLIAVAEICSWYTTLTTNFLGSVIEESIWAATATLMTLGARPALAPVGGARRRFIGVAIVLNAAYVVFMCTVDVPMYALRWRRDAGRGARYLTRGGGDPRRAARRIVTRRWQDWREEIPWMTLYFSAGVWISISLVRAPLRARTVAAGDADPSAERYDSPCSASLWYRVRRLIPSRRAASGAVVPRPLQRGDDRRRSASRRLPSSESPRRDPARATRRGSLSRPDPRRRSRRRRRAPAAPARARRRPPSADRRPTGPPAAR